MSRDQEEAQMALDPRETVILDWGHLSSEAAERQNNEGADEDTTNHSYGKTAILIDITDNDLLFAV